MFITKYVVELQFPGETNITHFPISHTTEEIEYWSKADRTIECSDVRPTPYTAKPVTKEIKLNRYFAEYSLTIRLCNGALCYLGSWDLPNTFQTPPHKPMCMAENLELEVNLC